MLKSIISIVFALTLLTACGGGGDSAMDKEPETKTEAPAEEQSNEASLTIEGDDQMQFDKKEMTVKAGAEVTLTLKHTGKMPVETMGHNWVLLKQGTGIAEFAEGAATAGLDGDYIPADASAVIAHTKTIGGGEETTITFTAPEAGTYEYICSFPGHWAMMKGTLIVE